MSSRPASVIDDARRDAVRAYVESHRDEFVAQLSDWLRIPSVWTDPERAADVRRSAEWLADALRGIGFPTVEIWTAGGPDGAPCVFAEWPSDQPDAKTVVVYGHHDVQPVDPVDRWSFAPFEPAVVEGPDGDRLLGRGASDDKGQVLYHLLGLRANLDATGRTSPPVNLKFVIEGEEESGSPKFTQLLREKRDRLDCDVVVVSDTGMYGEGATTVCIGVRGLTDCQIDLHGPDVDLHSGSFGGAVPNPLTAMAKLLAGLHDDDNRVTLKGFYDNVRPLSDREREMIAKLPFDEARWLATAESRAAHGEAGYSTLERIWARPTCEIHGVWGGYMLAGHKTIVPTDAHAKVSFRLIADQQPLDVQAAFRAYVEENTPPGITANVHFFGDGVQPYLVPLDDPALQAVASALGRAFDDEVLFTREGGSGPEAEISQILQAPLVFLGVGLPTDRIHAPDEHAVIPLLLKGAEAVAYLWDELAAQSA
ncbi:MAG TPA: dipeptidase [Acidothermaceae bacterium]|jgi:acetylornithine deacetylase/succinyl-diaminopimelate desuccinylase-like protein